MAFVFLFFSITLLLPVIFSECGKIKLWFAACALLNFICFVDCANKGMFGLLSNDFKEPGWEYRRD